MFDATACNVELCNGQQLAGTGIMENNAKNWKIRCNGQQMAGTM